MRDPARPTKSDSLVLDSDAIRHSSVRITADGGFFVAGFLGKRRSQSQANRRPKTEPKPNISKGYSECDAHTAPQG